LQIHIRQPPPLKLWRSRGYGGYPFRIHPRPSGRGFLRRRVKEEESVNMDEFIPSARRDLEFLPVRLQGKQYVLIRDHLGLVQEGKAVEIPLYQFMVLLDGTTTTRDLQMALMRQRGGMLVSSDEVKSVIAAVAFSEQKQLSP